MSNNASSGQVAWFKFRYSWKWLLVILCLLAPACAIAWLFLQPQNDPCMVPDFSLPCSAVCYGCRVSTDQGIVAVRATPALIHVYKLDNGDPICQIAASPASLGGNNLGWPVSGFDFSANAMQFAIGIGRVVHLLHLYNRASDSRLSVGSSTVNCLCYSNSGKHLLVGREDGVLMLISPPANHSLNVRVFDNGIARVVAHPDKPLVAVASRAGHVVLIDLESLQQTAISGVPTGGITGMVFSAANSRLYLSTATTVGRTFVYGSPTKKMELVVSEIGMQGNHPVKIILRSSIYAAVDLALGRNDGLLAVGTGSGRVLLINLAMNNRLSVMQVDHPQSMIGLTFVHNGDKLFTYSIGVSNRGRHRVSVSPPTCWTLLE